ncbi:hypothetical protein NDU88_006724 [Pleurodeles waltl]|uniref:Uncharacterized protein n=1 Tax=Pleurodeles waltl TaxID=8319 RepID=A0AAV7NVX7_PLEWA|nr:hypothetical protein NDU88_006724 [Pleurodeles waltl]
MLKDVFVANNVRIIGILEGMKGAQAMHFIEEWLRTVVSPTGLSTFFMMERVHTVPTKKPAPGVPPRPIVAKTLNYRDQVFRVARERAPILADNTQISLYSDYTVAVQRRCFTFTDVKRLLRAAGLTFALIFPAKLKILYDKRSHFFDSPVAAQSWMDYTLPESQKMDTQVNPPPSSRQQPRRHCSGVPETMMQTVPSLHQARASQRYPLLSAAPLKSQLHCPSGRSPEGGPMDSDTDSSRAFSSIILQTANDQ